MKNVVEVLNFDDIKLSQKNSLLQKLINTSYPLTATYTGGNHAVFLISTMHFVSYPLGFNPK